MSFLDGGGGPRVPTAQTFPPIPLLDFQVPSEAPPPPAEGLPAFGAPPANLPAHLRSLATMLEREARRLDLMQKHPDDWGIEARGLYYQAKSLAAACRGVADDFEEQPYPISPKPKAKGV